jgi:hypothetical protein
MHILLEGVEKEKCLSLLNHFRKQKLNVLERAQDSTAANEELVQINCIINNINVNPPIVVEIYETTWKRYTPDSLKEGITAYTDREWEDLNKASYAIFTDHQGQELKIGDSIFIYYEDRGAIIATINRFTLKGVIVGFLDEERFLRKDHSHRILKVN